MTKASPVSTDDQGITIGENTHQGRARDVRLSNEQRVRHIHLIGSSGSGKSTLMLDLINQDLERGEGLCVIDPHGDLVDQIISHMPEKRLSDVVVFDPSDSDYPVGFNILQANSELEKTILASDLTATFRRMSTSWGDVMDSVLANAVLAFVENSRRGTLLDLKRFLIEKPFRREFLETVTDDGIRYYWEKEFPLITSKPQASILIRLDTFLRQKLIRNIVCQPETGLNFRNLMDTRRVLLIKLSQGLIGEENAYLLGTLLVSKLYQMALSRQDTDRRPYFWLYLDEFHHFITPSMEGILSGARKYNLGLILAHQEFRQLQSRNQEVASSVLSNCYTRVCFRLGDTDADKLSSGFSFFDARTLQNLGIGEAIARIERAEFDFNLKTRFLEPVRLDIADQRRAQILAQTRANFARPRVDVETALQFSRSACPSPPASANLLEARPLPTQKVPKERTVPLNPLGEPETEDATKHHQKPEKAPPDRGMYQHKYLQSLIKRIAEQKGFRCTIEKQVFGGIGNIDITLENDQEKIACEISITNQPDYEVQNLEKCLSAGFVPAIMISPEAKHLEKIRQLAKRQFSDEQYSKILFFSPDEFYTWMNALQQPVPKCETVKGFRVNVKVRRGDSSDQSNRKRAITDVILGALKRSKDKG